MGAEGGGGHVRGVKILAGAQREADAQIAVAQTEDLVLAVDVGDLVDIAVVFRSLADLQRFLFGDGTALAGLDQIGGEIAQTDAAVVLNLTGALAVKTAGVAAGTVADGEAALILVQPVRDVLDGDGGVGGVDGLFHRDDVHADAVAAGRHEVGLALQREEGHLVEALGELGVLFNLIQNHVRHLGDAGNEQLDIPLLLMLGIFPVVLHDAVHGGVGEQFHNTLFGLAGEFRDFSRGLRLAQAHLQHDFRDFVIGTCAVENDVFRVFLRQPLNAELVFSPLCVNHGILICIFARSL